jgi:hypothetical protein
VLLRQGVLTGLEMTESWPHSAVVPGCECPNCSIA